MAPRTKAKKTRKPDPSKPKIARKIAVWSIDRLKPFARNSRTHSADQLNKLAKSIQRFGFTNPVLVSEDGTIIAGHGRVAAAQRLGMTELPVIVASGWTDDERRAYVIADNKLALEAGWDEELLKLELTDLTERGFDLDFTGFDQASLDKMLNPDPPASVDLPTPIFQILIECADEGRQLEILEKLQKDGISCRALIA